MPDEQDSPDDKYDTIKYCLDRYRSIPLDRVNLFGIVTYVRMNRCIQFTVVDESCGFNDCLKGVLFSGKNDTSCFEECCQVGDIVRLKRTKIQEFNEHAQACVSQWSSWVTFKGGPSATDYKHHARSSSSIVSEADKKRVKELREWLKTNPRNQQLFEANLACADVNNIDTTLTDDVLNREAARMNMAATTASNPATTSNQLRQPPPIIVSSGTSHFTTFSALSIKHGSFSHCDIVCQLCAVCATSSAKFLIVWDGTRSNYAVLQENDFLVDEQICSNQSKVLYANSVTNLLFHVYIFDEFETVVNKFKPGDYILLKNARICPSPANAPGADCLIKMPGEHGKNFGRAILKLASYEDVERAEKGGQLSCAVRDAEKIIRSIHQKGKELNVKFISVAEFLQECKPKSSTSGLDDTMEELVKDKPSGRMGKSATSVNVLTEKQQSSAAVVIFPSKSMPNGPMTRSKSKLVVDSHPAGPTKALKQVMNLLDDHASQFENDNEENQAPSTSVSPGKKRKQNEPSQQSDKQLTTTSSSSTTSISPARRSPRLNNNLAVESTKQPVKKTPEKTLSSGVSPSGSSTRKSPRMTKEKASGESEITAVTASRVQEQEPEQTSSNNSSAATSNNLYRVCQDLMRFKRLTAFVYLVPYMTPPPIDLIPKWPFPYLPHFCSLNDLAQEAATRTYMKCYTVARIFSYSFSTAPKIVSVYVHCPKCNYINLTPFHLGNIYHSGPLSFLLTDASNHMSTGVSNTQPDAEMEMEDEELHLAKHAVNFNLDWLQSVYPVHSSTIPFTQQMTQATTESQRCSPDSLTYEYECPRCKLNQMDQDDQESPPVILEYIYRFWLVLRDAHGARLDPCLVEGPVAMRLVGPIQPIKFFTKVLDKVNDAYNKLHARLNYNSLFTIETYKLSDFGGECKYEAPPTASLNKPKSIDILYKIVEIEEFQPPQ